MRSETFDRAIEALCEVIRVEVSPRFIVSEMVDLDEKALREGRSIINVSGPLGEIRRIDTPRVSDESLNAAIHAVAKAVSAQQTAREATK